MPDRARPTRDLLIILVLGSVTLSGPLAVHFFLPALPLLKQEFGVSSSVAQAAFSVTLFIMALSTLIYGSLSDRFGRLTVLAGGMVVFIVGSTWCVFSDSMISLIMGRVLQAIGAGCGLVLARSIAHDIFPSDIAVRMLALLSLAYAMGPMVAPPIGGLLVETVGWRSIFAIAAVTVTITLIFALWILPGEESVRKKEQCKRISVLRSYVQLFRDKRFCGFVFQPGFGSGAFFAHAAASSFLMLDVLERPPGEYGLYFIFFPIGYSLGTTIASRVGEKISIEVMVFSGGFITFLGAAGFALCVMLGWLTPLTIFIPGFVMTFGQGLALPNSQVGSMGIDLSLAGTAAGIGIFLQLFIGAITSQMTGLFADGTAVPVAAIVLSSATLEVVAGVIPLLVVMRARRKAR
jgi:DHA1 family bicyclomycin/chloramphenicol resistance-like MFS transporter